MFSRQFYSALIFLCIIFSATHSFAHPDIKTNILVLHSYNRGYFWTDQINRGLENTIRKSISNVEFYTAYMDTKRFPDKSYVSEYYRLFKQQYKGKHMDIIIVSDDAAYQFMLQHGEELFPGVPVVFCGVNNFSKSMFEKMIQTRTGEFTGVVEDVDIKKTIDLALTIHPHTKRIVVINDISEVGRALHAQVADYIPPMNKDVKFEFLDDMPIAEIQGRVHSLSKDSIILFLIYFRDSTGRIFTHDQSFRMISEISPVPIYTCWDIYNGLGAVGGLETMGYLQGETAANMAIRILNGEKPSSIPIVAEGPKQYAFDYIQLQRFHIPLSKLPPGSLIINKPVSFYDENKGKVWFVIATFSLLMGLIAVLANNILRRKKIEMSLRESEARFKSVVDNIAIGVALISHEMKIIALNRQMREWFPHIDVGSQPLCYDSFNDPPRGEICSYCPTCKTFADGSVHVAMTETPAKDKITNYRIISSPIKDSRGKVIYSVELVEDITDKRKSEQELIASEAKYRALFEDSKDAVFVSTPGGRYLDMNPAGMEMFGYASREDLLGIDIAKDVFVHPEDRAMLQKMLDEKGFVKDYEAEMKRKDGKIITVLSTITAVRNKKGEIAVYRGIRRDITNQKRLEQQLMQAQKMEAVGQLAGGIAHDFNNILTAIMGYGALLQTRINGDNVSNNYVKQILSAATKAADVTKSLLAFSRKQMMNTRPSDLNDIVRNIWQLLSRLIGEDIEITTALSGKPVTCLVDSGQMEQVLMNLTTNARDAMPDGGKLTLKTELVDLDADFVREHALGDPGKYAVLSVSDTGTGINADYKEKIFDPFFTTKAVGKGSGLGLAMVYGIVKQHGGYITVNSEPGKGTAFRIYLAAVQTNEECVPGSVCEINPAGGTETLLIAEDDENIRHICEIVLQQNGYTVIQAEDGEDAVIKFRDHKNDIKLVILDVIMPRKNGKEAYEEIKIIRPGIKVLFSSGYAGDRLDFCKFGKDECNFINKPVSPQSLLKTVREILDK